MTPGERIVRLIIRGRVQGVGFRAFVEDEAARLRLRGWVRNRHDGTVEATFAGPRNAVDEAIRVCREGPRGSRVDAVDIQDEEPTALELLLPGESFSVLRTE